MRLLKYQEQFQFQEAGYRYMLKVLTMAVY